MISSSCSDEVMMGFGIILNLILGAICGIGAYSGEILDDWSSRIARGYDLRKQISFDIKIARKAIREAKDFLKNERDEGWQACLDRAREAFDALTATQAKSAVIIGQLQDSASSGTPDSSAAAKALLAALDVPLYIHKRLLEEVEKDAVHPLAHARSFQAQFNIGREEFLSKTAPSYPRTCLEYYSKLPKEGFLAQSPKPSGEATSLQSEMPAADAFRFLSFLRERMSLPFYAIDSGCAARAHAMSYLLEKLGFMSRKIFAQGALSVKTPWAIQGLADWWFHVATLVTIDLPGQGFVEMVLDPGLSECPLTIPAWLSAITPLKCKQISIPEATVRAENKTAKGCTYVTSERFVYHVSQVGGGLKGWQQDDFAAAGRDIIRYRAVQAELMKKRLQKRERH